MKTAEATTTTENTAAVAAQGASVAPEKASSKKDASKKKGVPHGKKAAKGGKAKVPSRNRRITRAMWRTCGEHSVCHHCQGDAARAGARLPLSPQRSTNSDLPSVDRGVSSCHRGERPCPAFLGVLLRLLALIESYILFAS
jgi:hypothetical protein